MSAPVFYYDLGSPYAWLAAERIGRLLPAAVWQPILLGALFKRYGSGSWAEGPARAQGMAEVEHRAAAYGLPPVRWPDPWPNDGLLVMRASTRATALGQGRPFALAAYRHAFVRGQDLSRPAGIALAARSCGLDADALLADAATPPVKQALREATNQAAARGVHGVPTVAIGNTLFFGDDHLDAAAATFG
jgi:2-hydroxychromene-2-carboxylate isomerase